MILDKNYLGLTSDSEHFKSIDIAHSMMIPLENHPGGFGFIRKNHIHMGIDLYAVAGDPVYALENGHVVWFGNFTGRPSESSWWNDTEAIMIEHDEATIVYGEIVIPLSLLKDFQEGRKNISKGQIIGYIKPVLKKDKGRPTSMLHLEMYQKGTLWPLDDWPLNTPQPRTLLNPTQWLHERWNH